MITLAFGQMAFFIASSLAPYGGDDGLTIRARSHARSACRMLEQRPRVLLRHASPACSAPICSAARSSPRASAASSRRARERAAHGHASASRSTAIQLVAYVIAGALGGLAGFLLGNATEFVSPAYMSWQRSGELIIMVIFGGIGTLNGAIIGAAAFLLIEEWLSGLTEHWKVIFGPLLVLVVLFAPRRPARRRRAAAEADPWLSRCCASRTSPRISAACASPTT